MSLLISNNLLLGKIQNYIESIESFTIFTPYIKVDVLKELLNGLVNSKCENIITTWKPQDIVLGSSDLDVYPLCKNRDINLLLNNRIHLKAYVKNDFSSCIVTSSNLSSRGLSLIPNFNYELGVISHDLDINDKIYFDEIIENSIVVDDELYQSIKKQSSNIPFNKDMPQQFQISTINDNKNFLLTSLPMSDNIEILFNIYSGDDKYSEEDIRVAMHDIRLYKIPQGLDNKYFLEKLKEEYFSHPFIKSFLNFTGDGKFFGELTRWLHNKCTTVPIPRRFIIKEALQRIIYFSTMLNDRYEVTIPGNHSEFFRKK